MSLSKHFNFKPKEYASPSHGVRSKKIIRTWASQLKKIKAPKAVKGAKGDKKPASKPEAAA